MSERRVEIAVRVRSPDNPQDASCVSLDPTTRHIHVEDNAGGGAASGRRSYKEDFLFDEHVANRDVFEELVLKKMQSTSPEHPDTLCFLAYGHTSSGKTYSIAGSDDEPGILRLCVEELLRREGVVEVAMLEVYMDSVNDLLAEGQPRQIRRRQGPQGPMIVVEGLTTCSLTTAEQWQAVSAYGMRSRRTAPTQRNARSSRSHAIFTIKSRSVHLCLVDLAGSERQTVFSPQLNRESISINKSLSRLSTVLEALSSQRATEDGRRTYVNFRDTTLTVLLQRYLTRASLTTFLACVHPSACNYQETLSTLRYTQRLKRIRTRATPAHAAPEEWSWLKPGDNHALLDELMRLREQVREKETNSRLAEAAQQRRIAELEQLLAAQQQQQQQQQALPTAASCSGNGGAAVQGSGPSLSPPASRVSPRADGRVRDMRRVAGWLLSRVLGELPELNVGYDDYFDGFFPPSIQVIGYVSTMAGLVPRTADADPLAFLDVGDLAMGFSMLDAGIPPFVRLHKAGCAHPSTWEGHEWIGKEHGVVYVLAFFEYSAAAMTLVVDAPASGGESLLCCGGYVTLSPLLPIATVLCVPTTSPRRVKEEVLQRLIDLQCEQQEAVKEQAGGDHGPSSSGYHSSSSSSSSKRPRRASEHGLPAAVDLLDASLIKAADDSDSSHDYAEADGSLLAQELRRQAADTSHLITPFKKSSSTSGSSRSFTSDSSAGAAAATTAVVQGTDGGASVHRDLLADFEPAGEPAKTEKSALQPSPAATQAAEEPTAHTPDASALPTTGPLTGPPPLLLPPPRGAVPLQPPSPAPLRADGAFTTRLPPPSPGSPSMNPAGGAPVLSKRHRREKGNGDKTARTHGCQSCEAM
jgi:hypothetical protein